MGVGRILWTRRRVGYIGSLLALLSLAGCDRVSTEEGVVHFDDLDASAMAGEIRDEFQHAWSNYERYAWGRDELEPLSRRGRDWYGESLYMTPVDSLDSLVLLGFDEEADRTREYIAERLRFDVPVEVQVFEVSIRLLGGLLSSYELTGDERLLDLAEDLGERLLPAFESPTGMPYRFVDLATGETRDPVSNPAEISSLILEFGALSHHTGRPEFRQRAKGALVAVHSRRAPATGLVGEVIDVETGEWLSDRAFVGARIDSYYEYLKKCEVMLHDAECGSMWREARTAMHRYLADEDGDGLWYGEADLWTGERTRTHYGALHAFLPGVLALDGDLDRARRLHASGLEMWEHYGIEPDVIDYRTMEVVHPRYPLRPEIFESTYVLYAVTEDPRYRAMGRTLFEGLVRHCRTPTGYTVLEDVKTKKKGDLMHSFFLAETLKYLYLLYEPDVLDFDSVVFNSEAHPLRRLPALGASSDGSGSPAASSR